MPIVGQGITIKLLERTQTGADAFNRPIYTETVTEVENVLVGEPTTEEITNTSPAATKMADRIRRSQSSIGRFLLFLLLLVCAFTGKEASRTISFSLSYFENSIKL